MKNKLHRLLIVMVCIFWALTGLKLQAKAGYYVEDKADLLTESEEEDLNDMCVKYSELYELDIAIVTSEDMQGRYFKDYASNYYVDCGYTNGFLLLIDMEDRKVFILSAGTGNDWITDNQLSGYEDDTASYLKSQQYYDGCVAYIENIVFALDDIGYDSEETGPYYGRHNETETSEGVGFPIKILISVMISAGLGALITFLLVKFLGGTDGNTSSSQVYRQGNAILVGHSDIFIREEVTKTRRSDDDNNSDSNFDSGDFGGGDGSDF